MNKKKLFVILSIVLTTQLTNAVQVPFPGTTPAKEKFTNGDIFDDDLDYDSGELSLVQVDQGKTLVWNQNFDKSYNVLSSDLADIDELTLYGHSEGKVSATIRFWLTDNNHEAIGSTVNNFDAAFNVNVHLLLVDDMIPGYQYDGDDVLGNLKGKTIKDFHLEITPTNGTIYFGGGKLYLEADDIEVTPEPATLLLLSIGGLFLRKRKA
jgi:hypothetical protein